MSSLNLKLNLYYRFAHPVTFGEYPQSMRSSVGDRLPKFSAAELKLLKGSIDFLGVNYYTASYADPPSLSAATSTVNQSFYGDMDISLSSMYSQLNIIVI